MLNRVVTVAALAVGGMMLSKKLKQNRGFGASSSVSESIEINVPVKTAYNQWTQFDDFPQFMKSVKEIRQLDDKHLHWRANVAGEEKEWDVEITEQVPDKRIAWRSITGVKNGGVATFHKISDNCCRVMVQMDWCGAMARHCRIGCRLLRGQAPAGMRVWAVFHWCCRPRWGGPRFWRASPVSKSALVRAFCA